MKYSKNNLLYINKITQIILFFARFGIQEKGIERRRD